MKLFSAFCVLALVCSTFGAPDVRNNDLMEVATRDIDLMSHTRDLIIQLVENLRKSAQEALNSVQIFNAGILKEAEQIRDKIISDVQQFKIRVTEAIENVMNRISNTSVAVKECVDSHRSAAAAVFNETLSTTLVCVDERIADVSKEIEHLGTIANDAMEASSHAMEDMKRCTADNTNLWTAGSCLGTVAVQTEMKSVGFLGQSTMTIGRINLGIASLPASLEFCAGGRLIQTGIQTGKIIVDVGTCSATGIFNTIIGKPTHVQK
ncbi:hypothetical protein PYW07_001657 [Mythimna separata]|uniref:Uncharacterized protein n=1 Tax=Mythimna separata TaxID=271217 RepID=A0AAD7YUB2_MYTSE|nr:hypothetical protein PYW07_001657 [Mythimna separata]